MAEHKGESESLMEKITDKIRGKDSSSDSDDGKPSKIESTKSNIRRLFGREKPVHKVLGGGKPADVLLWKNKKLSASVLGGATALWVLFEALEYHLLTLVCHILILTLAVLFLWSNASTFINKSPPQIPEVHIHEKCVLQFASALRVELNRALDVLRDIASGRDLRKFLGVYFSFPMNLSAILETGTFTSSIPIALRILKKKCGRSNFILTAYALSFMALNHLFVTILFQVIAGLWVLSVVGSWCNFLTLFYISFVVLLTVPVLYEKYEDKIDPIAEKALIEIKKQYAVFDEKVLSKIPKGPLKQKKKD